MTSTAVVSINAIIEDYIQNSEVEQDDSSIKFEKIDHTQTVKFSRNRQSVRNDNMFNVSIRCSFTVTTGIYYYEALCLTFGKIRLGFTTRDANLTKKDDIGNDRHSIGFDVVEQCIWHRKVKNETSNLSNFKPGDVIGCLINVEKKQFIFYHNGQEIDCKADKLEFSSLPYFAAASLTPDAQIFFNFGQTPFKYCPNNAEFKNSCIATREIALKHLLLAPVITERGHFWFKDENRTEAFYCDSKQAECDQLVNKYAGDINIQGSIQAKANFESLDSMRFIQSIIEVVQIELTNHSIIIDKLCKILDQSNTQREYFIAKIFELIHFYLKITISSENTIQRHNICMITIDILNILGKEISAEISKSAFLLLSKTFINTKTFFNNPQMMLNVLTCFVCLKKQAEFQNDHSVITTLWWCAKLYGKIDFTEALKPKFDFLSFQIGFCSQWLLENFLNIKVFSIYTENKALNPKDASEYLKLSKDMLSVRSDQHWQSCRSTCSVSLNIDQADRSLYNRPNTQSSNVYFYEVVLLTDGPMRIGWATNETNLKENKIGDDPYSVAFDGHNQIVRHNGEDEVFSKISRWKAGDVLGCLINFNTCEFVFYFNGYPIECPRKFCFSNRPYFAAVSLSEHQHCYFNFGQAKFAHEPKGFHNYDKIVTLNEFTLDNSTCFSQCYEFIPIVHLEKIELLFDDIAQSGFDKKAKQLEKDVSNKVILKEPLENDQECLRMIQSFIEIIDTKFKCNRIDVISFVIGAHIKPRAIENPLFLDQICKLIYPYMQLCISNGTLSKHRNICIVLSIILAMIKDFKLRVNLHRQTISYLTQIVINSENFKDKWILLFALVALEHLNLDIEYKQSLSRNIEFIQVLLSHESPQYKLQNNISEHLYDQIKFCCQRFRTSILEQDSNFQPVNNAVLNPQFRSANIKLSPDLLTARSDFNYQSVRSVYSVKSGIIYYEMQVQTCGEMIFGWTTNRLDLKKCRIGQNEFSIGYDTYRQCVLHDGKKIEIKNCPKSQLEPGDVVGCLIDVEAQKFVFYLNKMKLELDNSKKIFFCPDTMNEPYYAAFSLFDHQQCRANFGQEQFKFPPYRTTFDCFNSQEKLSLSNQPTLAITMTTFTTTITNSNIKDTVLTSNSKLGAKGGISISENQNMSKKLKRAQ